MATKTAFEGRHIIFSNKNIQLLFSSHLVNGGHFVFFNGAKLKVFVVTYFTSLEYFIYLLFCLLLDNIQSPGKVY